MLSEMKNFRNWVVYQLQENSDGRLTKIPYDPMTGRGAMANNPETWASYDEAVNFAKKRAKISGGQFGQDCGIGFEFGNSPFVGIDLDHCIDDNGNLADWAADIVATMNSYTEYSPSGHGLHIIFKGEILKELSDMGKQGVRVGNIELYYGAHYFTVTEKTYGEPKPIIEASERAQKVFNKYLLKKSNKNSNITHSESSIDEIYRFDLLGTMFNNPKNGEKIRRLYNGDIPDDKSASEADLALCNHLAFYTGGNAYEMDRLFRQSGLMRPKWDEKRGGQTYGEMTITEAINSTKNHYGELQKGNKIDIKTKTALYRFNSFEQEIKQNSEKQAVSTGFENLDNILDGGLYSGLYFLGANSSLGKTSLILQIADNIAKSGRGVLFLSLEMSASELIAKSLSRLSFLKSVEMYRRPIFGKTTRDVLLGRYDSDNEKEIMNRASAEYKEFAENLCILEGVGDVGVNEIKNYIDSFIDYKGTPPIIIIDYLQILAPYSEKMTDKQNTDKNVLELKRLSRDFQIPVIGISSFNRENYKTPVSMASFKESGAIEYSSDILMGMQYDGWDYKLENGMEKESDRTKRLIQIRENMHKLAKEKKPQKIQLKILKNRNGIIIDTIFEFYPYFNCFKPLIS